MITKNKKAEMDLVFKILLWVVVFAILVAGVYLLTKNLWG